MLKLLKVLCHPIYRKIFLQVLFFHPTLIELERLNLPEEVLESHLEKMLKHQIIYKGENSSLYTIHPDFQSFIVKFIVSAVMSLALSLILSFSNRQAAKEYRHYLEEMNQI